MEIKSIQVFKDGKVYLPKGIRNRVNNNLRCISKDKLIVLYPSDAKTTSVKDDLSFVMNNLSNLEVLENA